MYRALLCSLILVLLSSPVDAQAFQRFEGFGGYQYNQFADPYADTNLAANGWNASLAYHFTSRVALKADFGGGYGTDTTQTTPTPVHNYTYTFGPVFSLWKPGRLSPFGELLIGGYEDRLNGGYKPSRRSFALLAGGGLDAKVHKHVALRLGELDYVYLHALLGVNRTSSLRFSAGIVFRF